MKIIIKGMRYFTILSIVITAISCKDLLNVTNPSDLTLSSFFLNEDHARSSISSIYADLQPVYDGGGYGGSPYLLLELPTGLCNYRLAGSAGATNLPLVELNIPSDNRYLLDYWSSHYRGIANANLAIKFIPDIEMDDVLKDQLIGEAKFLRAYYYYNLVRIFGDVPLILDPIDLSSKELFPNRTSVELIYDAIISDLIDSENSSLPVYDETGRVSILAAKSLLASVYLTIAGYPLEGGIEFYEKSMEKAKEVIDANIYYLFDDYSKLRSNDFENIGENIFMVQYNSNIKDHNGFQQMFLPATDGSISLFEAQISMIFPVDEFVESYDNGDKRAQEKEFFFRTYPHISIPNEIVEFDWHIFKWFDVIANTQTALSGLNWPLIRYPEVLFIYAEASNEVYGPNDIAYNLIDMIRKRADLPTLNRNLDKTEFREVILKEKWHELCFENKTWYDMVRLRIAYDLKENMFTSFIGHKNVNGYTLTEKNLLFPIPDSEISNNSQLTQNPGY